MQKIGIIIPCYNEANRLHPDAFIEFESAHAEVELIFVNDGSTDQTAILLEKIKKGSKQAQIISLSKNRGKGEAIRQGFLYALSNSYSYTGYLDADLSTTLEEFYRLIKIATGNGYSLVLGSRIKKIDTKIERSFFRHIIGRIIATAIDARFQLGIYDTQCGAKVFQSEIIKDIVQTPFYTKWFFDIEILLRIFSKHKIIHSTEIALSHWQNKKDSKISFLSFPLIIKELITLIRHY